MSDNHGVNNAISWWDNIKEMVNHLEDVKATPTEDDDAISNAEQRISESVLSVEVRSDWHDPCDATPLNKKAAEYRILLTWGGPALQIIGTLSEYGEPLTAELQHQDWMVPWTNSYPYINEAQPVEWDAYQATLLAFVGCFWFGE